MIFELFVEQDLPRGTRKLIFFDKEISGKIQIFALF